MNRFCEKCERVNVDGNRWCPEKDCPAELGHGVMAYGDCLGDLKITRALRVTRTAALYEASRAGQPVLLKVAHENEDSEERLKREALALAALNRPPWRLVRRVRSYLPSRRPVLPVLLPPYPVPSKRPYGEISFRGETKFYCVFDHAQGKFLSDLLLENPQLWHYQAAWTIITIAEALRPLAAQNKLHLCLTPDVILLDQDSQGNLRPLLLDLGFIVDAAELERFYEWPRLVEPAYTAPELLGPGSARNATLAADTYSLGIIFYEMLAGRPGFPHKLKRDEQVRDVVAQNRAALPVERPELEVSGVVKIVDQATSRTSRYNNVVELGQALAAVYGQPPAEKRPVPTKTYVLLGVLSVILLITLGVALFLIISALLR